MLDYKCLMHTDDALCKLLYQLYLITGNSIRTKNFLDIQMGGLGTAHSIGAEFLFTPVHQ